MLTYSQTKECIEDVGREGLEALIALYSEDVVEAGFECNISPADIEDSYRGKFEDDEEMVEKLLTGCGDVPPELPWYVYIDWKRTAKAIMQDYVEHNGYYFRIN